MTLRLGIDLGGTKTEAVIVKLGGDAPDVIARKRIATDRERGYEHIVDQTRALALDVAREARLDALPPIGVGLPGAFTRAGLVKNANTTCLIGRPFGRDLSAALGTTEVAFANDANCFALAEATWGAARDARLAFGVILGTGVGGGIVIRDPSGARRTWDGAQGIAGEWGHTILDLAGPLCYCGKHGCVETYLSGPAIERAYAAKTGVAKPLSAIADDPIAKELLAERADLFGRAIATVINVLDPDVVVLGGGVSNLDVLYRDGVAAIGRWIFNDRVATKIVKNTLGDSAGVLGAALLPLPLVP